jgi:hypothetical protein
VGSDCCRLFQACMPLVWVSGLGLVPTRQNLAWRKRLSSTI